MPRILMIPTDTPNAFKRLQLQIRLAYARINKSQGQSTQCVVWSLCLTCIVVCLYMPKMSRQKVLYTLISITIK